MSEVLKKYIPEEAIPLISQWFKEYKFHLRITKKRQTKLGDFRPSLKGEQHKISVNGDLNRYHFLITLTHEIAHAAVWNKYRNKVAPHGIEWKTTYSNYLKKVTEVVPFPTDLQKSLTKHLNSPKASSCSDPELYIALKKYDTIQKIHLEDLSLGDYFVVGKNKKFKKGNKRRSRYECVSLDNGKLYLVSAHAEVKKIENTTVNKI